MTRVFIPTPLYSYTGGQSSVEVDAASVADVMARLDAMFPGIRFRMIDEQDRIRPHMRVFVGGAIVHAIDAPIAAGEDVHIMQGLSGG